MPPLPRGAIGGLLAVRVRGPFRGPSGYDRHVRAFVRELHAQGVAVELVDLPEWGPVRLPAEARDPWFETLDRPVGAGVLLQFCMPHQLASDPERASVNYTMFEATRIPASWVGPSFGQAFTVVPTESSRRAWVDSGAPPERLRLCPLGVDAARFGGAAEPLPLRGPSDEPIGQYRVRFLNVSEIGPRKNLVGLLRVWLRATDRRDDAILIVKLGAYSPGSRELLEHRLRVLEAECGRRLDEAAPVRFLYDLFADEVMPRLFASATHYVSMSHGEGWDQPMVEAAATGLRLIAPDHSAYRAYLDRSVASLIPSREVPAAFTDTGEIGALFDGLSWWEPDEGAAIALVRSAIRGGDADKASARARVLDELSWQRATGRLITILEQAAARRSG
jgi:glycosyltransferase involved in cell wall biosynthesis